MTKRGWIRLAALVLALLMPILTATAVLADGNSADNGTKYPSPDINVLMGAGQEPEELSVSAGAVYQEKAWYEYVMYSEHAVASYRLDDDHRLLFYDPYTYTNSMIMDVQFDATTTEFDTMSSYSVSHTTTTTMEACVSSTYTSSDATQTSGRDITHSDVKNTGTTKTIYNHSIVDSKVGTVKNETTYEYKQQDYQTKTISQQASLDDANAIGGTDVYKNTITVGISDTHTENHNTAWLTDKTTNKTVYGSDYKASTKYTGTDTVEYNNGSETDGWTELSARVTKTIGSSTSNSTSWSETEGTTVTKTYAATHFASDGVTPLPWAIVHYRVQMPMKCCLQVKYSGEWVTISTIYCLLTTVQGTCRAWMQNGQVYYEDWGSGEPVVATDFWSQFMTREQLMNAYKNKLYPVGGVD